MSFHCPCFVPSHNMLLMTNILHSIGGDHAGIHELAEHRTLNDIISLVPNDEQASRLFLMYMSGWVNK